MPETADKKAHGITAWFGRNRPPSTMTPSEPRSYITTGLHIDGDIETENDILLEGSIVGNLKCRYMMIGASGELEGGIQAREIIIAGKVIGDIRAQSVRLMESAQVIGDIEHEVIVIEVGARVEGFFHPQKLSDASSDKQAIRRRKLASADAIVDVEVVTVESKEARAAPMKHSVFPKGSEPWNVNPACTKFCIVPNSCLTSQLTF